MTSSSPSLRGGSALAAILGAAPWILTLLIAGRREPWDHGFALYLGALALAGVLPGSIHELRPWVCAAAATMGQVAAYAAVAILPEPFSLWPLGLAFVLLTFPLPLAGAAMGVVLRRWMFPGPGSTPEKAAP